MKQIAKPDYNCITDWTYYDVNTGEIVEQLKMREFWKWDAKEGRYWQYRWYRLDLEQSILEAESFTPS